MKLRDAPTEHLWIAMEVECLNEHRYAGLGEGSRERMIQSYSLEWRIVDELRRRGFAMPWDRDQPTDPDDDGDPFC